MGSYIVITVVAAELSRVKSDKADRMSVIRTESRFNLVGLNHSRVHNMGKDLFVNRRTESIRWSEIKLTIRKPTVVRLNDSSVKNNREKQITNRRTESMV